MSKVNLEKMLNWGWDSELIGYLMTDLAIVTIHKKISEHAPCLNTLFTLGLIYWGQLGSTEDRPLGLESRRSEFKCALRH